MEKLPCTKMIQLTLILKYQMYQSQIFSPQSQHSKQQAPIGKPQNNSSSQVNLQKLNPNSDNSLSEHQINQQLYQVDYWLNSKVSSKWNYPIENERKGRFTQEEQRILSNAVGQFLAVSQITYEEFQTILNQKNVMNKILKKHNFFNLLSNLLPNRSANSCYRFLRRTFNQSNRKGRWTKQQQQKLIDLVSKHGRDWIFISKQMGRTSDNVYDKFRSMGSHNFNKRKTCSWSLKELIRLVTLVNQYSRVKFVNKDINKELEGEREHNIAQHLERQKAKCNTKTFIFHNYRVIFKYMDPQVKQIAIDTIPWSHIAYKIETRSFIDCKNKFMQILQILFKEDQSSNEKIIRFIESQNVQEEEQIKWVEWNYQEISWVQAKNRYLSLKKTIDGKSFKQFKECLKDLKKKYVVG